MHGDLLRDGPVPFSGVQDTSSEDKRPSTARPATTAARFMLSSLRCIKLIGVGAYARVTLVQHKPSGLLYALKTMEKALIIRRRQVPHVISEKEILLMSSHPNVVKLYETFNDDENIYMLLEFLPEGELLYHLQRESRFSDRVAAFYASNLVLGLQYLHSRGIVYRDLKPENIVMTSKGYLKLADFGFAKQIASRTWTICGTPEYIAPEIIQATGHGLEADWWSLGIVIYEMVVGYTPFSKKPNGTPTDLYKQILSSEITYPKHVSKNARDLISKLLVRDPLKRLGSANGPDITEHAWFDGIDFDAVLKQTIDAPFK